MLLLKDYPWLSKAILNPVKTKSKYFKLYRLVLISQIIYNKYRNVLTSVIKRAKANYYEGAFFKFKNNIKKTCSYIREIACKNSAKQPLRSLVNNNVLNSYTEIAEAFTNFFGTVASDLENEMQPTDGSSPTANIISQCNSMFLFPVTGKECYKIMMKLKNSKTSTDQISMKVMKQFAHNLLIPISKLINISFKKGVFPDVLKIACITRLRPSQKLLLLSFYLISDRFLYCQLLVKYLKEVFLIG